MYLLRKPSDDLIQNLIADQSTKHLTYTAVGHSRHDESPPAGYQVNQCRTVLGYGRDVFRRAKQAVCQLQMLNLDWLQVVSADRSLVPEAHVATLVRLCGVYALQVARIVYTFDEEANGKQRFGFGYGTLPEYPMRGEERFEVSIACDSGKVEFEVFSYAQPSTILAQVGWRYLRRTQRRFSRDTADAMSTFIGQSANAATPEPRVPA